MIAVVAVLIVGYILYRSYEKYGKGDYGSKVSSLVDYYPEQLVHKQYEGMPLENGFDNHPDERKLNEGKMFDDISSY